MIGCPTEWTVRGGERGSGRSRGGHGPAGRGRGSSITYATHTNADEQPTAEAESSRPVIPGLSVDQVQQLLTLIEEPKTAGVKLLANGDW